MLLCNYLKRSIWNVQSKLRIFMMLLQFCDSVETKIKKWVFTGSIDSTSDENLPGELYCFFKWIVQGPGTTSVEEKSSKVHKGAASLAQSTISLTLTERQSKNKKPEVIIVTGEMPQQLGVGLAIHQAFCSKEIIKTFHGSG